MLTPTERVRTMICSHGDEMSLLTTGTRRCKGNTAGVETGDSICGEKETCGHHHQEYCWEHRRETKYQHIYIPGEPQAQDCYLQFMSHTPSENKDLTGPSCPGVPIPMQPWGALQSQRSHPEVLVQELCVLLLERALASSSQTASVIIPGEDASWLWLRC